MNLRWSFRLDAPERRHQVIVIAVVASLSTTRVERAASSDRVRAINRGMT
jgi:hypothetical protein